MEEESTCLDIEVPSPARPSSSSSERLRPNKITLQVLATPADPGIPDISVTSTGGDGDSEDWSSDDSEGDLVPRGCCRLCKRSRACFIVLYLWLTIFVAGCFIAMLVVGILVVDPFRKAQKFVETTCYPVSRSYTVAHTCSCGKACNSRFPCLSVTVEIYVGMTKGSPTQLRENESGLTRRVSNSRK